MGGPSCGAFEAIQGTTSSTKVGGYAIVFCYGYIFPHSMSGAMASPMIDDMTTDIYSVDLHWHQSALERNFRTKLSPSFMNDFGIPHGVPL